MSDAEPGSLDQAAIAMHEIFMSYCRAGFTEAQALRLVEAHIRNMGGQQ